MVNLVYSEGLWLKKEGLDELLRKILRKEAGAKVVMTKNHGKALHIPPEGHKKFKDNIDEIAAKYSHDWEKITVEEPKGDEARCLIVIITNPGITRQELSQLLRIPKNSVKTILWRLETKKELIKSKTDKLGIKGYWLGVEKYWSTDEDYAKTQKKLIEKAKKLFQVRKEGTSIPEIAKQMNVSEGFVHKILERRKKVGGRPKKEIDSERLFQLRKEGKTMREIAKELNISHTSVWRELNKLKKQQDSSK